MGEAIKVRGIVLNKVDYKESDRICTLFTVEKGKITVSVKGVKKPTSKLRACSEIFAFGQYILNETRGRYTVTGYDSVDGFTELRNDFDALTAGTLMLQMCHRIIEENQQEPELFTLLLLCLNALRTGESIAKVLSVFLVKFCTVFGYMPQMKRCVQCGKNEKLIFFDYALGGIVCSDCGSKNEHIALTGECLDYINQISETDTERALSIIVDERPCKEAYRAVSFYTSYLFEERIKIMDFIKKYNII